MAAAGAASSFQLLSYTYVSDILEKRGPHRDAHIAAARQKGKEGKLILAGAVGAPTPEGGLFVFRDAPAEEIKAFVEADPYSKAGLISSWSIKPYNVVVNALEK
ncbi:hypothetical protein WJX81_006583 [Elliptochloris bilobata]|uniref:YCII-related domain-containing protein n=1 Tax=Elliptochloris bilobata TaxID=381761 RepID=A0AAW1R0V0_9CHLO